MRASDFPAVASNLRRIGWLLLPLVLAGCAMAPEQRAHRERLESGLLTPQDIERFKTPEPFHQRLRARARDPLPTRQSGPDEALLAAAASGDLARVRRLLSEGALANTTDTWGSSPMLLAAREGHAPVVRALADGGADVDGRGGDMPPLAAAALRGHVHVVRQLLRLGADPHAVGGNGLSALMNAVKTDRLEVAEVLLAAGADAATVDRAGDNLLIVCVSRNQSAMLDLLLRRGVAPDMPDGNGLSALYWAEFLRRPAMVQRLLQAGADPMRRKMVLLHSQPYSMGAD